MSTLYNAIVSAGIEIANHESDLYFPVTAYTTEILGRFPLHRDNATVFRNNIDGRAWYDVPFAYIPWWERRCKQEVNHPA